VPATTSRPPRASKKGPSALAAASAASARASRDVASPLGTIRVEATAAGLASITIRPRGASSGSARAPGAPAAARAHLDAAERALGRYLAGETAALDALPLDLAGLTDFQRAAYAALRRVPAGETRTYGALAALAGRRGAARAIGRAMARNPLPLAIPCHRVIGADGGLHGYSVGGAGRHDLSVKERLLALERGG
jgi:methylated-DNA-[protein]-cysteine S-methyltransferase